MVTGFGAEMGIGAVARAEVIAEAGAEATEAAGAGGGGPGAGAGAGGEGAGGEGAGGGGGGTGGGGGETGGGGRTGGGGEEAATCKATWPLLWHGNIADMREFQGLPNSRFLNIKQSLVTLELILLIQKYPSLDLRSSEF